MGEKKEKGAHLDFSSSLQLSSLAVGGKSRGDLRGGDTWLRSKLNKLPA